VFTSKKYIFLSGNTAKAYLRASSCSGVNILVPK
jgi:hypothetical protein